MQLLRPGGTRKEREHRWYRLAFVAAVIVFILLAPEVNNGNYMDPTITDGQALVTSKTSFTMNRGMPDRGQLVILKKPFSQEAGAKDNIITRVIGLPGDTVEITEGKVLVNDEEYVTPNGIKGCSDEFAKDIENSNYATLEGTKNDKQILGERAFMNWLVNKYGDVGYDSKKNSSLVGFGKLGELYEEYMKDIERENARKEIIDRYKVNLMLGGE